MRGGATEVVGSGLPAWALSSCPLCSTGLKQLLSGATLAPCLSSACFLRPASIRTHLPPILLPMAPNLQPVSSPDSHTFQIFSFPGTFAPSLLRWLCLVFGASA